MHKTQLNPDRYTTMPADLTFSLCSLEKAKWYAFIYLNALYECVKNLSKRSILSKWRYKATFTKKGRDHSLH